MPENLCPTCHSRIGTSSTIESERVQGNQGTDTSNNPVPRWSDDPLFTRFGFNGPAYSGRRTKIKGLHIKELQEARKKQEQEVGITPPTPFSDVDAEGHVTVRHIVELRESTERILAAGDVPLEDYFKLDDEGNPQPQNPNIKPAPQTEWVDVARGRAYINSQGQFVSTLVLPNGQPRLSPTLPRRAHIRAVHVEDLRHPVPLGIKAIMIGPLGIFVFAGWSAEGIFKATKAGKVDFKNVITCQDVGIA